MKEISEQQKNIFRLAAIIYGRSAQTVSIKKTHQRVVDDALFCCGKASISITDLISYIHDNYGILFSVKEITDIVCGKDDKQKYHSFYEDKELIISLTVDYKNKLSLICGEKNLYDYLDEFIHIYEYDENHKSLIIKFLYEVFTSNLEGYKLILQEKFDTIAANTHYKDEEKKVINAFLNWPDNGKNKAVYDLAGYALEYCMMTNRKNTSLNSQNLKNKSFYIDTNILYRAIGLNGENFKTRADMFLSKFKEVGENLVISQSTFVEFSDSIDYYIDKIDNAKRPKVRSKVFVEFIDENSIFLFYDKWCVNRPVHDTAFFKVWIMSELDAVCTKYEIKREVNYPYDKEKRQKELDEYVASIAQYDVEKPITSIAYDAENVMWVEEKRKDNGDDIYQAKAFLLSSDNVLRKWDYRRNSNRVPIVMSPSQWLGIILRYVERTSDDYLSFVSFLTLNIKHDSLPIDMLSTIVAGIAKMTSDIETQQTLARNFIESKTFDEMDTMSDAELEESAEEFAKTELEKRLEALEAKHQSSEKKLSETQDSLADVQKELEQVKNSSDEERKRLISEKETEKLEKERVEKEKAELKEQLNKKNLKTWKTRKITLWMAVLIVSVVLGLMVFIWKDQRWNFMAKLVEFVDGLGDTSAKNIGNWLVGLPIVIAIYAINMIKDACDVVEFDKKALRMLWKSRK